MEVGEIVQLLATYGPMGICLYYFITKDKQNQENQIKKQEETNKLVLQLANTIMELKNSFDYYLKEIKDKEVK